jgi:hypothetical protein
VRHHPVYCFFFFIIKLVVISVAGGAICRITALEFARNEKPGLIEAVRFCIKRFIHFAEGPVLAAVIIAGLGFCIFLVGLVGNIPYAGELLAAVLSPLAILAGFVIAAMATGTAAGFNLMFPAAAYDGADYLEVMSRSFAYIYAKPWRMAFYSLAGGVYGGVCYLFVRFFGFLALLSAHQFIRFGLWKENPNGINKLLAIWPQPTFDNLLGKSPLFTAGWHQSVAAFIIHLVVLGVGGLVVAFVISFYFSANTIIYALMRKAVDKTEIESVFLTYNTQTNNCGPQSSQRN